MHEVNKHGITSVYKVGVNNHGLDAVLTDYSQECTAHSFISSTVQLFMRWISAARRACTELEPAPALAGALSLSTLLTAVTKPSSTTLLRSMVDAMASRDARCASPFFAFASLLSSDLLFFNQSASSGTGGGLLAGARLEPAAAVLAEVRLEPAAAVLWLGPPAPVLLPTARLGVAAVRPVPTQHVRVKR